MAKRRYRWQNTNRQPKHAPVITRQAATREAEPMTPEQKGYLADLCRSTGQKFNPNWSKRQATAMIVRLKARSR